MKSYCEGLESLSEMVKTWTLRSAGRVLRQPELRPANVTMNRIPKDGQRSVGRPQQTWHMTFGGRPTRHGSDVERSKESRQRLPEMEESGRPLCKIS